MSVLLLDYPVDKVPEGGSQVVASNTKLQQYGNKEAAGRTFHDRALQQLGLSDNSSHEQIKKKKCKNQELKEEENKYAAELDSHKVEHGVNFTSKKGKKQHKKDDRKDLYKLIGLEHVRWMATEKQIKDAYRKTALKAHPDKVLNGDEDEYTKTKVEDAFKEIQAAYEALSDKTKRQEFDSTDTFDDSLPSSCAPEDFFKVFGPAFRRNTRWSAKPNAPEVGDENTEWDEVEAFYDFWFQFKSWRIFPHPDEEEVEQGDTREQRRWIERHNAKLREKGKKDETKRLREFVEVAYNLDPRVSKKKEQEKQAKEQQKQAKEAAIRQKREQEQAAIDLVKQKQEEEAAQVRAAAEAAKKLRDEQKQAIKKQRQRLRRHCKQHDAAEAFVDAYIVDHVCTSLSHDNLLALNDTLDTLQEDNAQIKDRVCEAYDALDAKAAEARRAAEQRQKAEAEARKKKEAERAQQVMSQWTEEEVALLDKALEKYPQGTRQRWQQVQVSIQTRTVEEIVEMVKVRQGASNAKFAAQEWKPVKTKKTQQAEAFQGTQASTAEEYGLQNGLSNGVAHSGDQKVEGSSGGSSRRKIEVIGASSTKKKSSSRKGGESGSRSSGTNGVVSNGASAGGVQKANGVTGGEQSAGKADGAKSDEWSDEQELALVRALKQVGKEVEDRWGQVSELVPGKSKGQCLKHFKAMRASMTKAGGK